ncbi:MAG: S-layer homology domain-containing protein [Oscillospiraceae bacterium]|nr:S-layer homology domain-containing protein [Oscillospiraceae bacterium]
MKKFLSLVLALVMTMSLVTISAGATEFKDLTDVDSIEHKEAVELFNKIGIITGYEDGSFGPEKTITREQAAKIIAIMALGNDAASKLGVEKAPFPDVPATSQFAGYIGYCASTGIINGYNDGTFKPKGTLTGYQFAKMLLGVLGYGVKDEYVGSNWALNVARDGASIGLFDDAVVTAGLINRDNATQIAFNALNSSLVTYSELLGTYTAYNVMTQTLLGTLAKNIFNLTEVGKEDGYGYNVHAWRQDGKIITDYYMSDDILGTEKEAISYGNLYKDYTWDDNVTLYVNGTQYKGVTFNSAKDALTGLTDLTGSETEAQKKFASDVFKSVTAKTMNGWTVNLVDEDEARVDVNGNVIGWSKDGDVEKIIVTIPYLAEVTAVKAATASTDRSVTLKIYAAKSGETTSWTQPGVETEEFEKGDMILVTPNSNTSGGFKEPLNMVKAETFDSTVSAYYRNLTNGCAGSVTADGTKYNYNFIFADTNDIALGDDIAQAQGGYLLNKATYTFYLDDCGNVIGVKVKDDAVNDYAYIISVGENAFEQYNVVKVLLSDGTIGTYNVSSKSSVEAYHGNTAAEEAGNDNFCAVGQIYGYSINSNNEIVLDEVSVLNSNYSQQLFSTANTYSATPGSEVGATTTAGDITSFTKGYSVITTTNGVVYATDSTVFVYLDGNKVTTYVGKSNAPSITSGHAKDASVVVKTTDGVPYATYVVVAAAPENSMTDNYIYVLANNPYGTTQDVNGDTVYLYKVVKDGAVVNLAADKSTYTEGVYLYGINETKYTGDSANEVEAGLYSLSAANEGFAGSSTGDYKKNVIIGVSSNDNVIVTPADDDQFVISPETEITDISNQSDIQTNASFKVGDTITVVYKTVSGLQVADAIYIKSHSAVTPTSTIDTSTTAITGGGVANGVYKNTGTNLSIPNCNATSESVLAFKFAMPVATSQTVTLTVTNAAGALIYRDAGTINDTSAHYFFADISGSLNNTGSGPLSGNGPHSLAAGTYNYTIEGTVSGLVMTGSFTI